MVSVGKGLDYDLKLSLRMSGKTLGKYLVKEGLVENPFIGGKQMKVKMKDLKEAAKELNTIVGCEPPISLKLDEDELIEKLKQAAELLVPEDAVPEEVAKTLTAIDAPGFNEEEESEEEEEEEESEEEEEEEESEEKEEEEEKPKRKRGKKRFNEVEEEVVAEESGEEEEEESEEEEEEEEEKPKRKRGKKGKKSHRKKPKPEPEEEEEEEEVEPKRTKKKAKKKSGKQAPPQRDFSTSTKAQVYKLWKKSKGKETPEKLHKATGKAVKLSTIRGWTKRWPKGNGLPAIAK